MCISGVFTSLISLALNTYYTGKLLNMGFWKQMSDLLPTLIYSIVTGILVWGITQMSLSEIIKLIIGIPTGISFYFMFASITKSADLSYLKIVLKNNVLLRIKK